MKSTRRIAQALENALATADPDAVRELADRLGGEFRCKYHWSFHIIRKQPFANEIIGAVQIELAREFAQR